MRKTPSRPQHKTSSHVKLPFLATQWYFSLFPSEFRCLLVATRLIVLTCISTDGIFKKVELLSTHFIKDLMWIDNLAYTKKKTYLKILFH